MTSFLCPIFAQNNLEVVVSIYVSGDQEFTLQTLAGLLGKPGDKVTLTIEALTGEQVDAECGPNWTMAITSLEPGDTVYAYSPGRALVFRVQVTRD